MHKRPSIAHAERGPVRRVVAGITLALALVPGAVACTPASDPIPATPLPQAAATASPGAVRPSPLMTPISTAAAPSPDALADLPAPAAAVQITRNADEDDGLLETTAVYRVRGVLSDVRTHYRETLRVHGWTITDVETDGSEWEIEARRDAREAEIELRATARGVIVEVVVSEPMAR